MRQLVPFAPDPVDPLDVYADVPVVDGRPGVRLNMIASIDGATAIDGVSGPLGGAPDRQVFLALRSLADLVLVAAGTVRAEGYGPARLTPELREARAGRGQSPVPRIAVVSRSLDLDWDSPFFSDAGERPIVMTVETGPGERRERAAEVAEVLVAGRDDVDLARAVVELGARGVRSILAEGGPSLNGALARAGLVDELCLTVAPVVASGDAKRILAGPTLDPPRMMALRSVVEQDGFVFLRYRPV